jgi:hypothetical protein
MSFGSRELNGISDEPLIKCRQMGSLNNSFKPGLSDCPRTRYWLSIFSDQSQIPLR